MKYLLITEKEAARNYVIGGKAENLFRLSELNFNVPKFIVIPGEVLLSIVPEKVRSADHKEIIDFISSIEIPGIFIETIMKEFPASKYFAVRSSAADEDGTEFSFAGQFESYLFVIREHIVEKIKCVWASAFSKRVIEYRNNNKLQQQFGLAVIIQEMIDAESSGVAFGINPLNGNVHEKLISSVFGLGEGIVSGELNADNFIINGSNIKRQVAGKTHKIIFNSETCAGTKKIEVEKENQNNFSLNDTHVFELNEILDKLHKEFGSPQDIEFALTGETIFLLQTRPVTATHESQPDKGEYIVWDNSNIVESYPGVTTPLTFSFIKKSYETAYTLFCRYMGVSEKVIEQNSNVFANTLGFINGRVYYNLKSWYHMLAMLPGYSINARFMEKMMGVKERFDIPESYRLSKGKAWLSISKMAVNMLIRFMTLPRKRKKFYNLLNTTISEYKAINLTEKNTAELMALYSAFEKRLLNEWKAPLLNDFFAMIWYGTLEKSCVKYGISKNPNIHNNLLCGSSDIISTQPIHRGIAIATSISSDEALKKLFITNDKDAIWKTLVETKVEKYTFCKKEIDRFIFDFGERCVGELKLETISYTQDPTTFIKVLKSYVASGITSEKATGDTEETIRTKAEHEIATALKYKPYQKWKLKRTLKTARELVSARENLRYERTRAFGIVRDIFSHLGKKFLSENIIDESRDIFYLTIEEIKSFIEGTSVTQDIKALIALRKNEFENYKNQNIPPERFATYGTVYHSNDFFNRSKLDLTEGDLKGTGCCPGRVKGKVRVVLNPDEISSLAGDILVTSSTDPGWVTLFPGASGIIVERGSVLSHSAIVSREMGKPCIVSVTGLLKKLKTGDEIEMDGSTGEIKIIKKA